MPNKVLLDANSIGFLHHQCGAVLKAGDQQTQAIFGSVQTIRNIVSQNQDRSIIALWDGRSWRKDAFPKYKAHREDNAKVRAIRNDYHSQTPFIRRALKCLGVTQVSAANLEADDLASILVERAVRKNEMVAMWTKDQDWLQLVQKGVVWHDHQTQERISYKNFTAEVGLADRFQLPQLKSMIGESGDLGPGSGVGGVGKVKAKQILDTWGLVDSFLADGDPAARWPGKMPGPVLDFWADDPPGKHAIYRRNMSLIDITTPKFIPAPVDLTVEHGEYDPKAFKQLCRELGFHSLLQDLPNFLTPFRPKEYA